MFRDYRVLPYLTTENTEQDADGRGQCFAYLNNVWKDDLPERLSATVRPEQLEDFLQTAQKLYAAAFPENVFTWYFVDDYVNRHYQQQKVLRNQISFFTVLAVGVACLGLLGMVANKVADKTKEISIRKILGAHSLHIIAVLLSSALKQVLFSIIIGIPVAWKLSEEFLVRYSERIKLQWWHYGVPVVILLGIMLLTIATLIWSAARKNPVDALKCE